MAYRGTRAVEMFPVTGDAYPPPAVSASPSHPLATSHPPPPVVSPFPPRQYTSLTLPPLPQAKLVLTLATNPGSLFTSKEDMAGAPEGEINSSMQSLIDEMGVDMQMLKNSSICTGDEEKFAFARALSRLTEMQSLEWIERAN